MLPWRRHSDLRLFLAHRAVADEKHLLARFPHALISCEGPVGDKRVLSPVAPPCWFTPCPVYSTLDVLTLMLLLSTDGCIHFQGRLPPQRPQERCLRPPGPLPSQVRMSKISQNCFIIFFVKNSSATHTGPVRVLTLWLAHSYS